MGIVLEEALLDGPASSAPLELEEHDDDEDDGELFVVFSSFGSADPFSFAGAAPL